MYLVLIFRDLVYCIMTDTLTTERMTPGTLSVAILRELYKSLSSSVDFVFQVIPLADQIFTYRWFNTVFFFYAHFRLKRKWYIHASQLRLTDVLYYIEMI